MPMTSTPQHALIIGTLENDTSVVLRVGWSPMPRRCVEDDFELWRSSTASGSECILGRKLSVMRVKDNVTCTDDNVVRFSRAGER